jgi:ABC-type phosphate transport system substrate-binding protein
MKRSKKVVFATLKLPTPLGVHCGRKERASRFALVAVTVLGCSRPDSQPTLTVDGSSTVFPITDAIADQFQKRNPVKVDVRVPVGISGTRGGFRKFCAGQTDISDASRPINFEEAYPSGQRRRDGGGRVAAESRAWRRTRDREWRARFGRCVSSVGVIAG